MNANDVIEWTHGPFSLVAVITHKGELIRMTQERRCLDVSDVADRTADPVGRSDCRSDAGVGDLISESESLPLVMGGQGRSNRAALLSALIAVLCIGGMGLIVGVAVVSSIVRWILSQ